MPTLLPTDDNNHPIQALRLKDGGAHSIAATSVSATNSTPFSVETQVVSLYATVPVYLRFSEAPGAAISTDHYFPAGIYYDFAVGGDGAVRYPYVAVLRAGASDGLVYLSEKI